MKLVLLPEAEDDLDEAIDRYIEEAGATVAGDLWHEVGRVAALLCDWPGQARATKPGLAPVLSG